MNMAFAVCVCGLGYVGDTCEILETEIVTLEGAMTMDVGWMCPIIMSSAAAIQSLKDGFVNNLIKGLNQDVTEADHVAEDEVAVSSVACTGDFPTKLEVKYAVDYEMYIATGTLVR